MSVSSREVLPGSLGVVRRTSLMPRSGRETHRYIRNWSGDPPLCPGEVGNTSVMSGSGQKAWM